MSHGPGRATRSRSSSVLTISSPRRSPGTWLAVNPLAKRRRGRIREPAVWTLTLRLKPLISGSNGPVSQITTPISVNYEIRTTSWVNRSHSYFIYLFICSLSLSFSPLPPLFFSSHCFVSIPFPNANNASAVLPLHRLAHAVSDRVAGCSISR